MDLQLRIDRNIMTDTRFSIPRDGYLSFDALTMKQYVKDRLNESGLFTDQNYEGSYLSTINEIISYIFHCLMFYLNRTSTESMFSEAQIYENMNRIIKQIGYDPIGKQAPIVSFSMKGSRELESGIYAVPRYSYVTIGNKKYSLNGDIILTKKTNNVEDIISESHQKLLYQGTFIENPVYTATGNTNEILFLNVSDTILIDHFNIDVYVYEDSLISENRWYKWKRVPTLFLEDRQSRSYEIRLNEDKKYQIKFGNDINGKKLKSGDKVAVYYLQTLGKDGEIGSGAINNLPLKPLPSSNLIKILDNINSREGHRYLYASSDILNKMLLTNKSNSTYYQEEEDVDSIRKNAPGAFRSQYRAVTENDYANYVRTNFANIIHDVAVVNNQTYLSEQMRYYYDAIGLKTSNDISNILYNQLNFADACNFNNIYITAVPKTAANSDNSMAILSPSQKELIITSLGDIKTLTTEVIILDPVYISLDLYASGGDVRLEKIDDMELIIVKANNSRRDDSSIIHDINNIFIDHFDVSNMSLKYMLDLSSLTSKLMNVNGVSNFYVHDKTNNIQHTGLSFVVWNPIYPIDRQIVNKNTQFPYFKYIYLNNKNNFKDKIKILSKNKTHESVEY